MEVNAKTKLACLIGHPVAHSFSPYIHNYLASKYQVDLCYLAFDIASDKVEETLIGMRHMNVLGTNVTIPHKIAVMDVLDEIDANAKIIGAVNTIKNESGKLIGYNTDGAGFVKSVQDAGHCLEGKCVMVLGAGGASRAVVIELASHNVGQIIIRNNTLEKAKALTEEVKKYFPKVQVVYDSLNVREEELCGVDYLINTTPLGMSTNKDLCPIDETIIPPKGLVVCDIVYTPFTTKFLKWAKKNDLQVVHGIGMLINQALESFRIWTGVDATLAYNEIFNLLKEKGVITE